MMFGKHGGSAIRPWRSAAFAALLAAFHLVTARAAALDDKASELAIYELDPKTETSAENADLTSSRFFHGNAILKRTTLTDASLAKTLAALAREANSRGTAPEVREGDIGVRLPRGLDVVLCFYCEPVRFRVAGRDIHSDREITLSPAETDAVKNVRRRLDHGPDSDTRQTEADIVAYAKGVDVAAIDPGLPQMRLMEWISSPTLRLRQVRWSRGDCDLQPVDANTDYPICARIDFRRGTAWGWISLKVGTVHAGIRGRPTLVSCVVKSAGRQPFGAFRDTTKLSEFPKLLGAADTR